MSTGKEYLCLGVTLRLVFEGLGAHFGRDLLDCRFLQDGGKDFESTIVNKDTKKSQEPACRNRVKLRLIRFKSLPFASTDAFSTANKDSLFFRFLGTICR